MKAARVRVILLALSDMVWLGGITLAVTSVFYWCGAVPDWQVYLNLWPALPLFVICNGFIRLYHGNFFYPGAALQPVEEMRRLFFSVSLTCLLVLAYLALISGSGRYARSVLLVSWGLGCVLIQPGRDLARALMLRYRIGLIRVLIAGAGNTGQLLAAQLRDDGHFGFEVVGFLDDKLDKLDGNTQLPRILGRLSDAVAVGSKYRVKYLICCLPLGVVQVCLRDYAARFPHITIVPDAQVFPVSWSYPVCLSGIAGVELRNQLLLPGPRFLKRCGEILVALVAIIVFLPLFLVLALLVKLSSPGPVLYRARRLGQGGRRLEVWKFRTMVENADDQLEKLLEEDPERAKEWRVKFKLDKDPRVTRLGRLLRKTSLDELPQLFNVLRGEMAMIGPRPIVEAEKEYYGESYAVFSRVRPGITGLWQVSGRSDTNYAQRVTLDMYYIMNWSFWLDLHILQRTILEVLRCRGAK